MNKEWSLKDQIYSDFLNLCDEETIIDVVKNHGFSIQYIKQPSEKVQLEAVKENGYAIVFIKQPSEKVQVAAVNQNFYAFEYIKNPSEEAQLELIKQNSDYIEYIKNPSEKVQLESVEQNGLSIKYIKKPSKQVQKIAINNINYDDVAWFIDHFINKINDSFLLLELYKICKTEEHKYIVKKSKYWKDDANLILEVINE